MTVSFNLIGLIVSDLGRSLAFYRRLGLDIPAGSDDAPHVEVTLPGGLRLAWDPVSTIETFDPEWRPPTGGYRIGLAFHCDSPAEVDARFAELVEAGAPPNLKPFDAAWGQRYASVLDPDGNSVELFTELPAG